MKHARTLLVAFALSATLAPLASAQPSQQRPTPPPPPPARVSPNMLGTGLDLGQPQPIPKAVVDYFAGRGVFRFGVDSREETSRSGGFGFNAGSLNDLHTNYGPTTFTTDVPPEVRQWVQENWEPRDASGQRQTQTQAMFQLGMYERHVDRERALTQFVNQWTDVVRNGSDQALLRAIQADPLAAQGIVRYSESHGLNRMSATDQVAVLRSYMNSQLIVAEDFAAEDRRRIEEFLQAQQELARQQQAMREASGEWLIEGGLSDDWLPTGAEEQMASALSEMERIEARIRAQLDARQLPDLTAGGSFASVPFDQIYDGYDPLANGTTWISLNLYPETPSFAPTSLSAAGNSLSAAGNSLSAAGNSLSAAGTSLSAAGTSLSATSDGFMYIRGQMGSGGLTGYASTALVDLAPDLAEQLYGALWSRGGQSPWTDLYDQRPRPGLAQLTFDPSGRAGRLTDPNALVAFLDDQRALELIALNDLAGLDRLLAQPFNVLVTWGAGMYDLDLHMTGPTDAAGQRFHIFYAATGDLNATPYAQLIQDCICSNGSEVILTSQLQQGGVYRISTFNYGDQSATSTQMSDQGGVQLMIVRGGEAVAQGQGTTISGGRVIFQGAPQTGQAGNTWVAVEIDPSTGRIYFVDQFTNSAGSSGVQ